MEQQIEARIGALEAELANLRSQVDKSRAPERVCLVCFSGDWDRLFAALTIANGALALGQEVHIFFTFWAVAALRQQGGSPDTPVPGKNTIQKMMAGMLPKGVTGAKLSRLNMMGISKVMLKKLMKQNNVDDIDVLLREARELGAHIHLCETSAGLFGLCLEELSGGESINRCGVTTFLGMALKSKMVLFI